MLDPNGNRTAVVSNAGTETYTLDALNRLTNVTYPGALTETFAYDAAGNRTSHSKTDGTTVGFTVDATGQLTSDTSGTTYTYDAAGNLTGTSDGESYTYDDYGRHTSISAGGVTQTYGYDATNTRVTVDGQTQLWDRNGGLPTLISTSGGDNYVHTAGVARDGADWLLADAVGSVRTVVDNTGTATGSQSFTAFGEQLSGSGTFGFAGEQQDPTGLQHLRARQYNPALGRFTTVDPVQPGAPGTTGYNLYAYSGNNPTTWTDPSGRAALTEYVSFSGRGALVGTVFGAGVGTWICPDSSASTAQQAGCIATFMVGGAIFGGLGPGAGLGLRGACAFGGSVGVAESQITPRIAGQAPASLGFTALSGFLGCAFFGISALLGQAGRAAANAADVVNPTVGGDGIEEFVGVGIRSADAPPPPPRPNLGGGDVHLALGLTRSPQTRRLLGNFADSIGASTWRREPFNTIFNQRNSVEDMIDYVVEEGGRISFNMDQIFSVDDYLAGVGPRADDFTAQELRYVCSNPAARAVTSFFNTIGGDPC